MLTKVYTFEVHVTDTDEVLVYLNDNKSRSANYGAAVERHGVASGLFKWLVEKAGPYPEPGVTIDKCDDDCGGIVYAQAIGESILSIIRAKEREEKT